MGSKAFGAPAGVAIVIEAFASSAPFGNPDTHSFKVHVLAA